jgi:hypothetical protein
MKHKYYDVILAWANGEPIQNRLLNSYEWTDLIPKTGWVPAFNSDQLEWRVKPKPKVIKYRLALMKNSFSNYIKLIQEGPSPTLHASHPEFVKWMTDWVEYEIIE